MQLDSRSAVRARGGNALAIVLVAVALVAVALVLLFTAGPQPGGTVRIEEDAPVAGTSDGADSAPIELSTDASTARRSTTTERLDEARAARDAAAAAHATRPRGRVVGRIADVRGLPVSGAEVGLSAGGFGGLAIALSEEGPVPGRRVDASTVTDERGHFALEASPGSAALDVRCSGFAILRRPDVEVPADGELDLGTLTLEQAVVLSGRVVDPLGRGIADVQLFDAPQRTFDGMILSMSGVPPGAQPVAVTDPTGAFTIDTVAAGPWRVTARHPDHPERSFEGTTERPGDVRRDLVFELPAGAAITGFVTGLERRPGPFRVRARKGTGLGFDFGDPARLAADVAADGSFSLSGLEADATYTLHVERAPAGETDLPAVPNPTAVVSEDVAVPSGARDARLVILAPGRIVLRVVDASDDAPVETFTASYGALWDPQPLLDAEGRVLAAHPGGVAAFEDVGVVRRTPWAGEAIVRIEAPGFVRRDVRVETPPEPGATLDLGAIALERAPLARITVLAGGAPVQGARVRLARATDRGVARGDFGGARIERSFTIDAESGGATSDVFGANRPNRGISDAAGLAVVELPASAGAFELRVEHADHATYSARVELPPGETLEHTVELGPGGTVTVRVLDPVGDPVSGATIGHRGPGVLGPGLTGGERTDRTGTVVFDKLTPGTHRFRIRPGRSRGITGSFMIEMGGGRSGDAWSDVVVEHGVATELVLTQEATAALAGHVRQDGAPLVGATVKLQRRRDEGSAAGPAVTLGALGGPSAQTDAAGRYVHERVEAGAYRLTLNHPSRALPVTFDVDVLAGIENVFDIDLALNGVRGVVLDEDGEPLEGIAVGARQDGGGGEEQRFLVAIESSLGTGGTQILGGGARAEPVRTDAQGRFELAGLPENVPFVVVAEANDVEPFTFAVESQAYTLGPREWIEGVTLMAPPAGSLRVEVGSEAMQKIVFLMVSAQRLDASGEPLPEAPVTEMGRDGACQIDGLEPGDYRVRVSGMGADDGLPTRDVTVVEGERVTVRF